MTAVIDQQGRTGRRLSVQAWFYLVLAIMVGIVAVGCFVGANLLERTNAASDRLNSAILPAQTAAYRLQSTLVDQETGVRGYALTADPQFLAPYTQGLADEQEAVAEIRRRLPDDADVMADLDQLEQAAAQWRHDYAEPLIGSVVAGSDAAPARSDITRAKQSFDEIRGLFDTQNTTLTALATQSRADLVQARHQRTWVLCAMVAMFFLTVGLMLLLVRFVVLRPLERLKASTRRIAAGDFEQEIEETGPADLRELAGAVENMRGRIMGELTTSQAQQALLVKQADDLDEQAAELRRSNAELEQFAYVASHDLQEPLRKVASFCQLLEKRYSDQLDERGHQYIEFAVDGAKRMQVLINDLLTFSRVGRVNDANEIVPLDTSLDEALASLSTAIEESGARIVRPDSLPEVRGDRTLMVMLWQNLVGNAIKFRAEGRPPVVEIECRGEERDGGKVWSFAVSDNGIGIPAEFEEKVFVIFQRLHARDAYAGTGIGLALCKKIVDYFGGRIWLDSSQPTGARICFTFPVEEPRPSASEPVLVTTEGTAS